MTSEQVIRDIWLSDRDGQVDYWLDSDPLLLRDMAAKHIGILIELLDEERA